MSKRKKVVGRKTREPSRSQRSSPGNRRWIKRPVGFGALCCVIIAILLLARHVRQRNRQPRDASSSLEYREPSAKPRATSTLSPEEQIAELKIRQMELAQSVMRDFPNSGEASVLMGDLHRWLGSSTKAVEFWQKGLELSPKRADVYHRLGTVALERGDFEQAISLWQKALDVNPQMPGVRNNIARALMGLGRHDEAIKELQEDIRVSPQSAKSHFLLGNAFLQQQDYDSAKMCYERTLELRPDHREAYYGLSRTCARLKQPDKAKEYGDIFVKLRAEALADRKYGHSPSDDLARTCKDSAELSMRAATLYQDKGEIRRAEELLKQAAAVDPNSAAPHKKLAVIYRMTNRIPAALAQCERIRQLEPNDPACHLLIATLALQLKHVDRAETALRHFIALCPSQSVGYRELAYLYIRVGRKLSEARKLAGQAVDLEPTAENYFMLGRACQITGDKQAALAAVRKAVELAPNNREYRRMYDLIK